MSPARSFSISLPHPVTHPVMSPPPRTVCTHSRVPQVPPKVDDDSEASVLAYRDRLLFAFQLDGQSAVIDAEKYWPAIARVRGFSLPWASSFLLC